MAKNRAKVLLNCLLVVTLLGGCESAADKRASMTSEANKLYRAGSDTQALGLFAEAMKRTDGRGNPVLGWVHILLVRDALSGNESSAHEVLTALNRHDLSESHEAVAEAALLYAESAQLMMGDKVGAEKSIEKLCGGRVSNACLHEKLTVYKYEALGTLGRFELERYFLFSKAQLDFFGPPDFAGDTLHALGYVDFQKAVDMKQELLAENGLDKKGIAEFCEMVSGLNSDPKAAQAAAQSLIASESERCRSLSVDGQR